MTMFDYDWFHGTPFEQQQTEAKWRCALRHFPDIDPDQARDNEEFKKFHSELEARILIYLRDGFSYEIRSIADVETKSHLVFECNPVDDQYKVGAFVISVPYDEVARVEVYAVHPSEKPDDMPQITGFRHPVDPVDPEYADAKHGPPFKPRR